MTLDESNDWTYLWMAESDIDWRVKEVKVPEIIRWFIVQMKNSLRL